MARGYPEAENRPPLGTYTAPGPNGKFEFASASDLFCLTEATVNSSFSVCAKSKPPIISAIAIDLCRSFIPLSHHAQKRAPVERIQVAPEVQPHPRRRADVASQIETPRVGRCDK